jgi:hypothetical protein
MGKDRKDGKGGKDGDAGVSGGDANGQRQSFDAEIRAAVRYEKGLFLKALLALALVALIAVLRALGLV